jgi:hypothetical protein
MAFARPYGVNFPQKQYLTSETEQKTPWWQDVLGAATQVGASYVTGGMAG